VNERVNPWVSRPIASPMTPAQVETIQQPTGATGPRGPQAGVVTPDVADQLPVRAVTSNPGIWLVGAHGGAGESTLATFDESWRAAAHAWPATGRCVLVARTSAAGLRAAQRALTQWAGGAAGGAELLGLVLVDDAPGRLPRPLRDLAALISGGAPRTWRIGWDETWRLIEPGQPLPARRDVSRLIADVQAITARA